MAFIDTSGRHSTAGDTGNSRNPQWLTALQLVLWIPLARGISCSLGGMKVPTSYLASFDIALAGEGRLALYRSVGIRSRFCRCLGDLI